MTFSTVASKDKDSIIDTLIIGAGPAGLQLAYDLEQAGVDYLLLEAADHVGAFFSKYPRHRVLLSINKTETGFDDAEVNLRWDWNSLLGGSRKFGDYSKKYFPCADDLVKYLNDFAKEHISRIRLGFRVVSVSRDARGFCVANDSGEQLRARKVVVATGWTKENIPNFPGNELAERYSEVSVDPESFRGQRVLVVGKGNSALEIADNLIETTASVHLCTPKPVRLAWNTHYVGDIRATNNNFLDTYQLKSQNTILDAEVLSLTRRPEGGLMCSIRYTHAKGELRNIPFDRAIIAAGFRFDPSIFEENCRPELSHGDRMPAMTSAWESTNIKDLYFAGTLMACRDYKKTMSSFIHGFRHNITALAKILGERYHARPWRGKPVGRSIDELTTHLLERLDFSPAMFLQPGFLGDVLIINADESTEFIDGVPLGFIPDSAWAKADRLITISLEYGDFSHVRDTFAIDRDPDPSQAHLIEYLHPILRFYKAGMLVDTFHLVEDLENVYRQPRMAAELKKCLAAWVQPEFQESPVLELQD